MSYLKCLIFLAFFVLGHENVLRDKLLTYQVTTYSDFLNHEEIKLLFLENKNDTLHWRCEKENDIKCMFGLEYPSTHFYFTIENNVIYFNYRNQFSNLLQKGTLYPLKKDTIVETMSYRYMDKNSMTILGYSRFKGEKSIVVNQNQFDCYEIELFDKLNFKDKRQNKTTILVDKNSLIPISFKTESINKNKRFYEFVQLNNFE